MWERHLRNWKVQRYPTYSCRAKGMATDSAAALISTRRKLPVLLFDVMDTLVKDPFFEHMPRHFEMTFHELLHAKHPSTWITFENGECDEAYMAANFFADGREVDLIALKRMMVEKFEYLPGVQPLLQRLKDAGYEMHAVSNYPEWFELIEAKLGLSAHMPWTFVSCRGPTQGLRKPDPRVFDRICGHLQLYPKDLCLIDDREANVNAALTYGLLGVPALSAADIEKGLLESGAVF